MKTIVIEAQKRETVGSKTAKQLRSVGLVPGIIYGKEEIVHFSAPEESFLELIFSPSLVKALIKIDGQEYDTLVKELQFHPVTDKLLHLDLLELVPGKPVVTEIPVKTEGRPIGVLNGGKLMTDVRKLKVRLLPENLREYIIVDVTDLKLAKSIKVRDLQEEKSDLEFLHAPSIPVATVMTPRMLRAQAAAMEIEELVTPTEEAEEGAEAAVEGEEGEGAEGEESTEGAKEEAGEK